MRCGYSDTQKVNIFLQGAYLRGTSIEKRRGKFHILCTSLKNILESQGETFCTTWFEGFVHLCKITRSIAGCAEFA